MSEEQPCKKRSNKSVISNSKARGVMVLIGALLVFQVVTFVVGVYRKEGITPQNQNAVGGKSSGETGAAMAGTTGAAVSFPFDPNTLSKDSLVLLGFSPKQAQVVINYREKGGRFRRKEDFARMYVVSEERYQALKERIVIREAVAEKPRGVAVAAPRDSNGTEGSRRAIDTLYGKKREQRAAESLRQPWRCDLNRADSATLVKLYGVGGYFARKILRYRERLGGWFVQAEQLLEIEGLEPERFEGFREKLLVDTTGMPKFLLDTLGKVFMEKHPYMGPYATRGILLYRESREAGAKITLEDLVREHILSPGDAGRLRGYIKQ